MQLQNKKFFKRQSSNVKDDYLFTKEEIAQKLATINLFEKFDADGSGALDVQELCILYNEQGIQVTEDEIRALYDDDKVLFTLNSFELMCKDSLRLRRYRNVLNDLKFRLS